MIGLRLWETSSSDSHVGVGETRLYCLGSQLRWIGYSAVCVSSTGSVGREARMSKEMTKVGLTGECVNWCVKTRTTNIIKRQR